MSINHTEQEYIQQSLNAIRWTIEQAQNKHNANSAVLQAAEKEYLNLLFLFESANLGFQNLSSKYDQIMHDLNKSIFANAKLVTNTSKPNANKPDGRTVTLGSMKGKVWMADDFDAPLDDFKEYM